MNTKTISGYWYGVHFLPVKGGRIQGLCGVTFEDEKQMLDKYDQVASKATNKTGPGLVRVYTDGTHYELRPGLLPARHATA